ncbi:hypothetical protein SLEP1_g39372 [Rubroshorea leprosula]|uniref:Uncharacterized protein n=1 Tax=Rubroshorea leprosula TaxID=152421 RepID=A0AAV5KZZ5_9ROSI|nr:hypothetical protein SLEP1_g39372 [Rubroshorea leprosula]
MPTSSCKITLSRWVLPCKSIPIFSGPVIIGCMYSLSGNAY